MPTRPIVELEVALLGSGVLAARGKLPDEWKLAVVAVIDRARLALPALPIIVANLRTPAPNALAKLVFFAADRRSAPAGRFLVTHRARR